MTVHIWTLSSQLKLEAEKVLNFSRKIKINYINNLKNVRQVMPFA